MSNTSVLTRLGVFTRDGIPVFLRKLFDIIESTYVRRSAYVDQVSEINSRLKEANYFNDFSPRIDESTGNLILDCLDGTDTTLLSVDNEGNLILDDDGSASANAFAHMKFHIDHNGDLIAEQIIDRETL